MSKPYHVSQGLGPANPSFRLTCGMEDVGVGLNCRVISLSESPRGVTRLPTPETEPKPIHLYVAADTMPMRTALHSARVLAN